MKKTGFTIQQHQVYGAALKAASDSLQRIAASVSRRYGVSSQVAQQAARAKKVVDELRLNLADAAGYENQQVPTSDIFNLYYGPDLDKKPIESSLPETVTTSEIVASL